MHMYFERVPGVPLPEPHNERRVVWANTSFSNLGRPTRRLPHTFDLPGLCPVYVRS